MVEIKGKKKTIAVICVCVVILLITTAGFVIHNFLYGDLVSDVPYKIVENGDNLAVEFQNFGSAAVISKITSEYRNNGVYITVYTSFDISKKISDRAAKICFSETTDRIYLRKKGSYEQIWENPERRKNEQ